MSDTLDELCINTIRFLSVDAAQKANSGHPGPPLGSAPMAYALWTRVLEHNRRNPLWFDRDRFVLSARMAPPASWWSSSLRWKRAMAPGLSTHGAWCLMAIRS